MSGIIKPKKQKLKTDETLLLFLIITAFLIAFFISFSLTSNKIEKEITEGNNIKIKETEYLANLYKEDSLNNLYHNLKTGKVVILGYHQIREIKNTDTKKERLFITPTQDFEKEMKYLKDNGFIAISLGYYLNYLSDNTKYALPNKPIILTFDDGYASQYENALPILKKYGFKATFFIYKSCIDKYPACMTSEDLRALSNEGMILANHTEHHAYLTDYSEDIIKSEILNNQKFLESISTENTEMILAYPYGVSNDRVKNILKELGFGGAVGVSFFAKKEADIFNLPRYLLGDNFQSFLNIFEK